MSTQLVQVGPFRLVEQIGTGGMADVWRGVHVQTSESVAVKIITGGRALQSKYRDRFVQEVQAVARLDHPSIVRVYDYGESEVSGGTIREGSPYLTMELADRGVLTVDDVNSFPQLQQVLLQLLDALAYSHARGVVHRDLKPANVLMMTEGHSVRAKLTDFGIAHANDPETELGQGRLSEAAGTPDYMPPEQLRGDWRDYGPWTDLYALGVMTWELATGTLPFRGATRMMIAMSHMTSELPAFTPRFHVPPALEQWLRKCLSKDGWDRYQSCADAAFHLARIGASARSRSSGASAWSQPGWGNEGAGVDGIDPALTGEPVGLGNESSAFSEVAIASTTVLSLDQLAALPEFQLDRDRPPLPPSWRTEETEPISAKSGLGLSLFGLREIPFVDRQQERDAIWEALKEVENTGRPRLVLMRGPSGVGKSRTAQWITRRAAEVGGAQILTATHGPSLGPNQGVGHMLERWFVTWQLDEPRRVFDRVRERLGRLWSATPTASSDFLDHESRALAAIASSRGRQTAEFQFASPQERLTTAGRLLSKMGEDRPVALWIDDVQWGDEALALVEEVLRRDDAPVLILATVQDEALRDGALADRLEAVANLPASRVLHFRPLAEHDQHDLVTRLLHFDSATSTLIARATAGNPLFAVQLVTDWVERGVLQRTPQGYSLGANTNIATSFQALWLGRINRLASRLGGPVQRVAIELAATLGNDVKSGEWETCCLVADIAPHERLVDELVEQGLVIRTAEGWSFVHRTLPDSLRDASRDDGRWGTLNRICGEVLKAMYPGAGEVRARIADHFLAAEDWANALQPLASVTRSRLASGDILGARETIEARHHALLRLGVPDADERRVENLLLQSTADLAQGNAAQAEPALTTVIRAATHFGWRPLAARAYRLRGELRGADGRMDAAVEDLTLADQYIESVSDPVEHGALLEARAWVLKTLGDAPGARSELETALDLYRETNDTARELNVFNRVAHTFLAEGDFEASREVAEMGIELSRQASNRQAEAGCLTTLGTVERQEGNLEAARRHYEAAAELDELGGSRHLSVVVTNLGLLEVEARNWLVARDRLEGAVEELAAVGWGWMIPVARLAQACCAAGLDDWAEFDALWHGAMNEVRQKHLVDREFALLSERIAEIATEKGADGRAKQALHFAMRHWQALGSQDRARAIRARLRT